MTSARDAGPIARSRGPFGMEMGTLFAHSLLLGGVALCLVSAILGFPDLMKGFQDGSR